MPAGPSAQGAERANVEQQAPIGTGDGGAGGVDRVGVDRDGGDPAADVVLGELGAGGRRLTAK
mgnify:CR=1 FL=1